MLCIRPCKLQRLLSLSWGLWHVCNGLNRAWRAVWLVRTSYGTGVCQCHCDSGSVAANNLGEPQEQSEFIMLLITQDSVVVRGNRLHLWQTTIHNSAVNRGR
jgi:hypothetical protein